VLAGEVLADLVSVNLDRDGHEVGWISKISLFPHDQIRPRDRNG
jgi:hypothetical protein